MNILAAALIAPLLAGAAPPEDETARDVRCLIVALSLTKADDPGARSAGMMSALYYMGRLDGRDPQLDLASHLIAAAESADQIDVQTEAKRCGEHLQRKGETVQAIGRRMTERERPQR